MTPHSQPQRQHGLAAVDSVMGSRKKEWEDDAYMFHLVSYKWFRRTQYIPRFGGVLQEGGDFTWRVSDCEELVGLLTGDEWGWI